MPTKKPATELKKAIAHHDTRFLAVRGFGTSVSGIWGGVSHPLVPLAGVNLLPGPGDVITSTRQLKEQKAQGIYAESYNALLLQHLIKTGHPLVLRARREADDAMGRLERANPTEDARKLLERWKRFPSFCEVLGQTNRTPGVSEAEALTMGNARGYSPLPLSRDFLTPNQNQRLNRLIKTYIIPYNRYIFQHYTEYAGT
ncbi:hypothetical protein [Armatimonas sp.]|uniref:hypothetical protein n=1 Tax=Armatimonas sp. TaxID=1872638 RepID=UPI00374DE5A2